MAEKFGLQPDQRIPGRLALTRGSLPVEVGTHHAPTGDAELGSYGTDGVASVHAVFFRSSRYAACAVGQDRRPRLGPLSCDTRASPFSKRRDSRRRRRWDPRPSMLGHPASRLSGDLLRFSSMSSTKTGPAPRTVKSQVRNSATSMQTFPPRPISRPKTARLRGSPENPVASSSP